MKIKSSLALIFTVILLASCAHHSKNFSQKDISLFTMNSTAPIVGKTVSGQEIYLGGFSGLSFIEEKNGAYFFNTITDRGPNGWSEGNERPFLLPEFSPQIVTLKAIAGTQTLSVVKTLELKKKNGKPLSGLPNMRLEENPTDLYGLMYSIDPDGLDTEALTSDSEGGFWVGEEYGPSLVHFNSEGKMIRRLSPGSDIPKIYAERRPNRGFEAIAKIDNRLFGFLQSPLPKENQFSRIVEVDTNSNKAVAEYFYPFETGNDKIGDAVMVGKNSILVIEQNGKTGNLSSKLIYKITLKDSDALVEKKLIADLKSTPFNNVEKVEGLALINSHTIALTYDNDFQIDGKTDRQSGITPLNKLQNQLLILNIDEDLSTESK